MDELSMNEQINKLKMMLQLEEYSNKRASELSGGSKRKLCSAIALLNNPLLVEYVFVHSLVNDETFCI